MTEDQVETLGYRILFGWWIIQSIALLWVSVEALNGQRWALNVILFWLGLSTLRTGFYLSRFIFRD